MTEIAVVADDLSGAVETAAAFLGRAARVTVAVDGLRPAVRTDTVQVLDTHTRGMPAAAAGERVRAAVASLDDVPLVVKKIDSLLRGNLAAELTAAAGVRPGLVVAPALPAAGRTVRDGVVLLDGVPLPRTDAWRVEPGARPDTVVAALAPLPTRTLDLAAVRGDRLRAQLHASLADGLVPVCDASTDDDLDRVVSAAGTLDHPLLVGSAGLAAAVARTLPLDPSPGGPAAPEPDPDGGTLVVVGSAASTVPAQLAALGAAADRVVLVDPEDLLDEPGVAGVRTRVGGPSGGLLLVALDPRATLRPQHAAAVAAGLAGAVHEAAAQASALVLTGGATARAVLDRLGVTELRPLVQVHHGAVVCAAPHGRLVATRPGSFGGTDSLLTLVRAVSAVRAPHVKEPA